MGECQSNLECRRDEKNTGVPEQPSETARNRRSVGKPEGVGTGSVRAGNRRNRKPEKPESVGTENRKTGKWKGKVPDQIHHGTGSGCAVERWSISGRVRSDRARRPGGRKAKCTGKR